MARRISAMEDDASPPPTKRDIRRNRIVDRLKNMVDSFSAHQHHHYRAQLQAVQVDMTLILNADPYAQTPEGLDEDSLAIREAIEAMGGQIPNDEGARGDYDALAGKRYREFVRLLNDGVEKRDAGLTALKVRLG
jgi:hypothetical protein